MKYIEKSWQSFASLVLAKDASAIQREEMRSAFYAGAAIIFEGMIQMMDDGDEPTDSDMQKMAQIQLEITAFGQELDKQVFGNTEH